MLRFCRFCPEESYIRLPGGLRTLPRLVSCAQPPLPQVCILGCKNAGTLNLLLLHELRIVGNTEIPFRPDHKSHSGQITRSRVLQLFGGWPPLPLSACFGDRVGHPKQGTAQCTTDAPTFDPPVEFSLPRLGKYWLSFVAM